MANTYDGNGDYTNYAEDESEYGKQRKMAGMSVTGPHNGDNSHSIGDPHHGVGSSLGAGGVGGDGSYINEKANEYMRECINEKARMNRKFPLAEQLLDDEIEKIQTTGRLPSKEQKYADIYREKPLRISQKVLVPTREHPKFNFVGKLLGPKGNSLRRLQEETMCKMTVLGRNSMRDRVKEEELRKSKDPKYSHLNSDLHVEISTVAPPAEAYARLSYAMAELRKYLIPDSNDVIRQEQLRELMDSTHTSEEQKATGYKKIMPHGSTAGGGVGILGGGAGAGGVAVAGAGAGMSSNTSKNMTPYKSNMAAATNPSAAYTKNNTAPKQKVMSILEKARTSMEETYNRGYEENLPILSNVYDNYAYAQQTSSAHSHNPHASQSTGIGVNAMTAARGPYDTGDYEANDYSRRSGDYYQNPVASYGAGLQPPNNGGLNPSQSQNRSHVNRPANPSNTTTTTTTTTLHVGKLPFLPVQFI